MVKQPLLFVAALSLCACNFNEPQQNTQAQSQEESPAAASHDSTPQQQRITEIKLTETFVPKTVYVDSIKASADSFRESMDSLMTAKIKLPPIYKHEIIVGNNEAVDKFTEMAKASGGAMKVLIDGSLIAEELVKTLHTTAKSNSDLMILIDKTGSMAGDIETIRQSVGQIMDTLIKHQGVRVAIGFYGDKNYDGMEWYRFKNFETEYADAMNFINNQKVSGGGDWPESVYDAVMASFDEHFWKSDRKRTLIVIGDAPPLDKPLSTYSLYDVLKRSESEGIKMNFYPIIITPAVEKAKVEKLELAKYQPTKIANTMYPNPSNGVINVSFAECGKYIMEIYSVTGQEILSEETYGVFWSKELGDIPNGMYILRMINAEHKFEVMKFVVNR